MPVRQGKRTKPANVWQLARVPHLQRYCHLISRAHARLKTDPQSARKCATAAAKLLPGRAAPLVIIARLDMEAGKATQALLSFDKALAADAHSVEQPQAMHELAAARWKAGRAEESLDTYRMLVPRASLLASRTRRARVLLEAAHVAMAAAPSGGGDVTRHLDEALAYLREAARDPHQALRLDIALSLVLALDRAGRRGQADAILAEQRSAATWAKSATFDYLASPDDLHLLHALALETTNPTEAGSYYRKYIDSPSGKGIYAAAARARLARLDRPQPRPRRRRRGPR